MRFLLAALVTLVFTTGCKSDPTDPECLVRISDVTINGDVMTAEGTFVTAQPLLILGGADTAVIPGIDDGNGHATFDLSGLPPGNYDYHFDASCYDENENPTIESPTGFFSRA